MVAGIAAALLDQRPSLLNFPEQMKAILLAGSEAKHALTPGGNQSVSAEGLGTAIRQVGEPGRREGHDDRHRELRRDDLQGRQARATAGPRRRPRTIDFEVPYASRKVRFVIDWMAHTGRRQPALRLDVLAALRRLQPHDPQGLDGRRQLDAERIERRVGRLHRRRPWPGIYTAVVTPVRWGCSVATEPVGWAWVSFTTP